MSDIGTDQLMSEELVKSCKGTHFHFSGVISCVVFKTPNKARVNLVLIYFHAASASFFCSNAPILRNVSVAPIIGSHNIGADKTSPNTPIPLAFGRNILYLSKLLTVLI